ncbi:hypothetical protein V6N12_024852 [Hibiscus sabdariffa]|uniref:Uncharacterized protein n=1 Tax=Hibiscus sabdariffa TaxID=183260 RepID=A0ABR2B9L2_9ROSI
MANIGFGSNKNSQVADDLASLFGSGSGEQVLPSTVEPVWFPSSTFSFHETVEADASNTSDVSNISENIPQSTPIVEVDPAGACLSQQQLESADAFPVTSQSTHPGLAPGTLHSEALLHCDSLGGIVDTLPTNSSNNDCVSSST